MDVFCVLCGAVSPESAPPSLFKNLLRTPQVLPRFFPLQEAHWPDCEFRDKSFFVVPRSPTLPVAVDPSLKALKRRRSLLLFYYPLANSTLPRQHYPAFRSRILPISPPLAG